MKTQSTDSKTSASPEKTKTSAQIDTLVQSLPYIQKFAGTTMVLKYGGNAMLDETLTQGFARDVTLLHSVGIRPIVVHGGGPQIGKQLAQLGVESHFINGHRVTDETTLEIVRMVLVGKINKDIVGQFNQAGGRALGFSGEDAQLIKATQRNPELGFVGDVASVNVDLLQKMIFLGVIPVIASIGVDESGQAYNINADLVAGALAVALQAEKLVVLTDVDGLLRDASDPTTRIPQVNAKELSQLIGNVDGGMLPKLEACLAAVKGGARSAHLVNGTQPHALLVEIFTDSGTGTMITAQ